MNRGSHQMAGSGVSGLADAVLRVMSGQTIVEDAAAPAAALQTRAQVDARALRRRFSDPALSALNAALTPLQRRLLEACEQARVEALGAARWPGTALNLSRLDAAQLLGAQFPAQIWSLLCQLRRAIAAPLPCDVQAVPAHWQSMPPQVARVLAAALGDLAYQQRFAVHCGQLLMLAGLWESAPVAALPLSPVAQSQPTAAPVPAAQQLSAAVQQRRARSDVLRRIADEPRGKLVPVQSQAVAIAGPYEVYSRQHDVVQRADRICTAAQAAQLQRRLDQVTAATMRSQSAAALRLQRCVLSRKPLRWQSDAQTGVLDPARLTSVLTDPLQPARLRSRQEAVAPDTHVTLLVDNSGSLRGKPIEIAAASVLLLVSALERCGVATEVLGFTTMGWRGGKAAVQWRAAGSPPRPGRIAALRHLVFKSPADSAARCRKQLAAMLHEDLLRENVDGEALQWALQRLRRSRAKRRILMVLCDGTPQEQATVQANDPLCLQRHLQKVVAETAVASDVQLIAIGLARDVSSCYPQALVVEELQHLGAALPQQLVQLLKPGARRATYPGRVSP